MSLKDFWLSVRTAARLVAPDAVADSPKLDPGTMEGLLRRATIWLTPASVDGFNPADFDFLTPAERHDLTEAVNQFREIARQVRPDQPATEQQIQQALPPFLRILGILRPDKYGDPGAFEIGKRIEQHLADQWPPAVSDLRFSTGEDSHGGPAVWIWVVLNDEAVKGDAFFPTVKAVRQLLEQTVRQSGTDRWPYVRFRTVSELEPPAKKKRPKK